MARLSLHGMLLRSGILIPVVILLTTMAPSSGAGDEFDVTAAELNESRDQLPMSYAHDFGKAGLPSELFAGPGSFVKAIEKTPRGIRTQMQSTEPWTSQGLAVQLRLRGDFDIEASFEDLQFGGDGNGCVILAARLDDPMQHLCRMVRMRSADKTNVAEVSVSTVDASGQRKYPVVAREECVATSGRLRLARRGDVVYYLFAEGDDGAYRIIGKNTAGKDNSLSEGISIQSDSNGGARVQVVWKKLTVHAEGLDSPGSLVEDIESRSAELGAEFRHSFAAPQLPMNLFDATDGHLRQMRPTEGGLTTTMSAKGNWASIDLSPRFELQGDFDIVAEFDQLELSGEKLAAAMLTVELADEAGNICRVFRAKDDNQNQTVHMSLSRIVDGERTYGGDTVKPAPAFAGRLRLSRLGNVVYALFAPAGSENYQFVAQRTVTNKNSIAHGITIRTLCNGTSSGDVRWRELAVRAEKILYHPLTDQQRKIAVMNLDGSDAVVLTGPPEYKSHVGSPEWSPDGKRIAFDASLGGTDTSSIMIMNADGTELEDLGPGCMPSFSPDGEQLVFSESGFGVIQMATDGSGRFQLHDSGWGALWSTSDKYIAWANGRNIRLMDLKTDDETDLFTVAESGRLRQVFWNMSWSADGRFIAAKASTTDGKEQVIVADTEERNGFRTIYSGRGINADFSWSPDGTRVLFSARDGQANRHQLYAIRRTADPGDPVEPLVTPPEGWTILDCDWSPDGKRIVCSVLTPPKPMEWSADTAAMILNESSLPAPPRP